MPTDIHNCGVARKPPLNQIVQCDCGKLWGPVDKWGGRTRVNEDGTKWQDSTDNGAEGHDVRNLPISSIVKVVA